jgi:hypothetical protein
VTLQMIDELVADCAGALVPSPSTGEG